jgi:Zn-dependent protease with chaperone function
MFFGRKNLSSYDATEDIMWRFWAWLWFLLSLAIAIATPFVAELWIDTHWAAVASHVLIDWTRHWVEVYIVSAICTLALFETGNYASHRNNLKHTPPAFMVEMLANLSEKAGIPTPRLEYRPSKNFGAATSSSLLFGSKIMWHGTYQEFTRGEIYSILAHEVGHLTMRDTKTSLLQHLVLGGLRVLALLQFVIMLLALATCFIHLFPGWIISFMLVFPICYAIVTRSEDAVIGAVVAGILSLVRLLSPEITAPIVFAFTTSFAGTVLSVLAAHAYSRVIEYRADAVAIDIAGPEYADDLMRALDKGTNLIHNTPEKRHRYRNTSILLMAHPRVVDRKIALEKKQLADMFSRHRKQKYN